MEKVCAKCNNILPISSFYKAGEYYQTNCKTCHNNKRLELYYSTHEKKNSFEKQPQEIQDSIISQLQQKKRLKQICNELGLNYPIFSYYRRKGYIKLAASKDEK
jgi:hypothetical protein